MEKNTVLAVILSTAFLIIWWAFFQPKLQKPLVSQAPAVTEQSTATASHSSTLPLKENLSRAPSETKQAPEQLFSVEGKTFKATFSSYGASLKSFQVLERSVPVELVPSDKQPQFSTFDNLNYTVSENAGNKISFWAVSPSGYKITKTYVLDNSYFHSLTIDVTPVTAQPKETLLDLSWGPGLGTDAKEKDENTKLTRALGFSSGAKDVLETFKPGEYRLQDYNWVAIDNRYFLVAVLPDKNSSFDTLNVVKEDKHTPASLGFYKKLSGKKESITLKFYAGPKIYAYLKTFKNGLGQTIDFGFFGFLGKAALETLNFFHKLTHNYGWAIIILTTCIQLMVFPLTVKSFKAQADMKRLQPHIKELQTKYKSDPKRLNMEMLNIYKTHKVNPLGGCLPMVLQLPIFWALFTTLRNAYELRGAPWLFWIKDLSHYDPFFVLPIIMGLGMVVQQKMVSVSADPAQAKMMMLMPVVFTFMFLKFPSGLVLYWITNSLVTMIEQYFFLRGQEPAAS